MRRATLGAFLAPACLLGPCSEAPSAASRTICCRAIRRPGPTLWLAWEQLFAGIVRAPMTSVVMIFETTQDYAVIVPLMISNLVSFFISSRLQPQAHLRSPGDTGWHPLALAQSRVIGMANADVGKVMRAATEVMAADMTVREAFDRAHTSEFNAWPVTDERGIVGIDQPGPARASPGRWRRDQSSKRFH